MTVFVGALTHPAATTQEGAAYLFASASPAPSDTERITKPEYRKPDENAVPPGSIPPTGTPGSDSDYFFEQVYEDGSIKVFEDKKTRFVNRETVPENQRNQGVVRNWSDKSGTFGDKVGKP